MKVVSLFDGMACGLEALKRIGANVTEYHAFEIDPHAIKVAKKNHPEIIHHGTVEEADFTQFRGADLLIGGSPCQGFSFAGKQLAFDDPRSRLFFEYVRARDEINPTHFLLENVKMKAEHLDLITLYLDTHPVFINSALVSAQNRQRFYWCNWPVTQPEDHGITWGDVRQNNVDEIGMYYTHAAMEWISQHSNRKNKPFRVHDAGDKMQMIEASHHKKYSAQRFFGVIDRPIESIGSVRGRRINPATGRREDHNHQLPIEQFIEFRIDEKSNCISTVEKDNIVVPFSCTSRIKATDFYFRYITPIECERLQTLPDGYTEGVSNTQRYRMLGNGWTVEVIAHLFREAGFDLV